MKTVGRSEIVIASIKPLVLTATVLAFGGTFGMPVSASGAIPEGTEQTASVPTDGDSLSPDEKVYICDGVLYRPTYYRDEQVYEIVSEPDEVVE